MKKFKKILVLLMMLAFSVFATGCTSSHGDGKTTCKNCGRSSIYALGFCKSCYEGFMDYTYGK